MVWFYTNLHLGKIKIKFSFFVFVLILIFAPMDITGKIKRIGKIEAKTNNFCKRKFVLEYKEKSSTIVQTVEFELKNEHVDSIEGFLEGDMIKVHFNVRGREFTGKDGYVMVFNSLDVF